MDHIWTNLNALTQAAVVIITLVSVAMYAAMNPFDTISQATPAGGQHADIQYAAPATLQSGDYIMFVEVSKEFDFNKLPTLPDLIVGNAQGRGSDSEITCFLNNIGLGYQFAAAGSVVYRKAKDSGLGHNLPTEWFTEDVHP